MPRLVRCSLIQASNAAPPEASLIATKQAMSFMQSMGGMLPEEKAPALKKKARESGYTGACPFADEK